MPYYLRFLKSPTIDHTLPTQPKKIRIDTYKRVQSRLRLTFTCQTDLGDAFYDGDLIVTVRVVSSASSGTQLACSQIGWKQGDRIRSDSIALDWYQELDTAHKPWIILEARSLKDSRASSQGSPGLSFRGDVLSARCMPEIISVLAPLLVGRQNQAPQEALSSGRHVLRRFLLPKLCLDEGSGAHLPAADGDVEIAIYEEIGESIARHIWDAALGLLVSCLNEPNAKGIQDSKAPHEQYQLSQLLRPYLDISSRGVDSHLEILELGSGCGIVGLGLARLVPNARFILTDLPEAMEILNENTMLATNLGLAPDTSINVGVLDWNSALIDQALNMDSKDDLSLAELHPNLIIVSDCTYNSDSFEALVATLQQTVTQGHEQGPHDEHMKLDVLVSYKHRHESESRFFKDMLAAGFRVLADSAVDFPDRSRECLGLENEKAEIFAFGWQHQNI